MPAFSEKPKSSETRRATKPIMEKRRRARINQCLTELKTLILDALNKDPSRHSKLEKADILEMTVRHLQNVQRQQMAAAISTDPTVLNKFRAGFGECANEVNRYISRIEGADPAIRQRLLNHLTNCLSGLPTVAFPGLSPSFGGAVFPSFSVQLPNGLSMPTVNYIPSVSQGDVNNNNNTNSNNNTSATLPNAATGKLLGGMPLIPSRLPNGDFALLLPSQALGEQLLGVPLLNVGSTSSSTSSTSSSDHSHLSQSSWAPTSPTSVSPSSSHSSALSPSGSDCSNEGASEFTKVSRVQTLSPAPSLSVVDSMPKPVVPRLFSVTSSIRTPLSSTSSCRTSFPSTSSTEDKLDEQQASDGDTVWRPW